MAAVAAGADTDVASPGPDDGCGGVEAGAPTDAAVVLGAAVDTTDAGAEVGAEAVVINEGAAAPTPEPTPAAAALNWGWPMNPRMYWRYCGCIICASMGSQYGEAPPISTGMPPVICMALYQLACWPGGGGELRGPAGNPSP